MADVSKAPTWLVGGRREIKVVVRDAEVDGLVTALKRANTPFSRDLLGKIERLLTGK